MTERPCLMVDISDENWAALNRKSIELKIPTVSSSPTGNSAGLIRALLFVLIRKNRIKCHHEEFLREGFKALAEKHGIYEIEFADIPPECIKHRQIRVTDDMKVAILELSSKLGLSYGQVVRNLVRFAIEKL